MIVIIGDVAITFDAELVLSLTVTLSCSVPSVLPSLFIGIVIVPALLLIVKSNDVSSISPVLPKVIVELPYAIGYALNVVPSSTSVEVTFITKFEAALVPSLIVVVTGESVIVNGLSVNVVETDATSTPLVEFLFTPTVRVSSFSTI